MATLSDEPVDPAKLCRLEGQVLHALTKEPLRKATVILRAQGADQKGWAAVTDEGGKFLLEGVAPGRFSLTAQRNGFLNGAYGARRQGQTGTTLQLTDGQVLSELTILLTPQGVITGRVLDEDGEPLQFVQIQALRSQYVRNRMRWVPAASATTDDTGQYRMISVAPGRYLIQASLNRGMLGPRITLVGKGATETYTTVFHPNASEMSSALPVDVSPGAEVRGIDFRLQKTRGYRVRGRVTGVADLNDSSRPVQISLVPPGGMFRGFGFQLGAAANSRGEFEIPVVPPGSYTLYAIRFDRDSQSVGRVPVTVSGDHVEGVTVSLTPGFELEGKITAEGNPPDFDPTKITVTILPAIDDVPLGGGGGAADKDGTLKFRRISPGFYQLSTFSRLDGYYLKAARLGNQDVTGQDFELSTPAPLELVFAPGAAVLAGSVQDAKGNPSPGAVVLAVPKNGRMDMQKVATADQNGNFELKGLTPGEYKVFCFEDAEIGGLMDPDARLPFESKAVNVKLDQGGRENLQLKVIPPL
jgi:protocatechuate 3,4-dioxygenase beta subunit